MSRPVGESAAADRRVRLKFWLLPVLLVLATLLVYVRVYNAKFVAYDDDRHLTFNQHLNPPGWQGLKRLWAKPYFGVYVPLAYTFYAGEAWFAVYEGPTGLSLFDPRVFHVTNVCLHAGCVLLAFAVLRLLVADDIAAALGALLFAWHPLQVESVAWVSETRGTLAGILSFWSIYEYLRFRGLQASSASVAEDARSIAGTPRGAARHYVLAVVAFLLALLCKPSAVSVPLMLGVLDLVWLRRAFWPTLLSVGWWLAPAVALTILTSGVQAEAVHSQTMAVDWWQRPLIAGDALDFYLFKLIVPYGLAIDYGRTPAHVLESAWVYVSWLLPLVLVGLLGCLPHRRAWLTAAGLYVAGVAPVLGFLSFAFQAISTVSDRYVYLAMLGPAFALAWFVGHVLKGGWRLETVLLLCAFGGLTMYYSGFWYDSRTLFERAIKINPRSTTAMNGLAVLAMEVKDYETSEQLLRQAVELQPNDPIPRTNLGVLYERMERDDEAIEQYRRAIEAKPGFTLAQLFLGMQYYYRQDWNRAVEALLPAVATSPHMTEARLYLGLSLVNSGRNEESLEHWQAILDVMPDNVDAHMAYGNALAKLGRLAEAREHFAAVLRVRPKNQGAQKYLEWADSQLNAVPRGTP
ncbi:MAG: tetratricopeptide repeat protein [Pirellulales bacterium]|nr:tetratricopeptide repeat protein [Pirellulales bacterium]